MADAMLFEVDASKIVAKLHLAGRQPLKIEYGKGEFLANTGVVDDDVKATPAASKATENIIFFIFLFDLN